MKYLALILLALIMFSSCKKEVIEPCKNDRGVDTASFERWLDAHKIAKRK